MLYNLTAIYCVCKSEEFCRMATIVSQHVQSKNNHHLTKKKRIVGRYDTISHSVILNLLRLLISQ